MNFDDTPEEAQFRTAVRSFIQTEAIDRSWEIVLTAGFKHDAYARNPIVTINHDYTRSPVGRSLWRRKVA